MGGNADEAVAEVYRSDWGRIVATLIRQASDFELAEEVAQEAFAAAVDQWRLEGVPDSPRAWILQTARHKLIDRIRRSTKHRESLESYALWGWTRTEERPQYDAEEIPDDRLRLIFTCCHPALAAEAQVPLTLRELCGLQTEEIARAFLVPPATMAQRLVRAKRKIRDARIPYSVPAAPEMAERLDAVLTVVYLIFNEGYASTYGASHVRGDLCEEAIRLARLIRTLMAPHAPAEATGLLALMLLHDARRETRTDAAGDLVVLEEQDRSRWNRAQIAEALPLVAEAFAAGAGPYAVQAAIAAEHCRAARAEDTEWRQILRLYDVLERMSSSPVVALNRAVAEAMAFGPEAGLAKIAEIEAAGELGGYHLLHAARADLLRRLGARQEAAAAYARALELVANASERRYLERRLAEVGGASSFSQLGASE
jgi:RNA polymerase sigma-70 factor, ECF subfamily